MTEEPQKETKKKQHGKSLRNTVLAVIGGLMLLAVVAEGFLSSLTALPHLAIPPRTLPVPNAYDIYVQAAKACAGAKVGKKNLRLGMSGNGWYGGHFPQMFTNAEANALAQANTQALTLIHRGLTCQYLRPVASSDEIQGNDFTQDHEHLGQLLLIEAQAKLSHGDRPGAMRGVADAMQFAEDIQHGSGIGSAWVSREIRRNALAEANRITPQLTASGARAAAQQMERALSHEVAYADIVQEEKWRTQANLMPMLHTFSGPAQYAFIMDNDRQGAWQKFQNRAQLCMMDRHELLRDYARYMDQLAACTSQPYVSHPPRPIKPTSPIIALLVETLDRNWLRDVAARATERRFMLGLALQAYYLDHGRYPDSLEALTPAYLSRLPVDPFALQGAFGYKKDRTGYTIFDASGQAASKN